MPSFLVTTVLSISLAAALPAAAQEALVAPAPPAVAPSTIGTLDRALEMVSWDAGRRGPLLVVDPQNTRPRALKGAPGAPPVPPPPLPPPRFDGHTLRTVADYFGRKVVGVDSLTVLAPTEMVVLNTRPGKPDLLAPTNGEEALRLLQASLSPAQWRLLGSERGLGLGDLAPEQGPLLLAVLPEPFTFTKVTPGPGGGAGAARDRPTTLSPDQRAGVRLRLRRATFLSLIFTSQADRQASFSSFVDRTPMGTPRDTAQDYRLVSYGSRRDNAFGVAQKQEVPNRLKPGRLLFDAPALQAPVSLEGVATLGDLVRRVGQMTGVELHADRRVANLPLWLRGRSARAGDVLKALCWAVTGTFRKVGPAFVLTDDLQGIGARRTRLAEWEEDARALSGKRKMELQQKVASLQPLQYLGFDAGDVLGSRAEIIGRIEKEWATGSYPKIDGYEFAVTELPPAQQVMVRDAAARAAGRNPSVRTDRVNVGVNVLVSYIVPGIGEIGSDTLSSSNLTGLLPRRPFTSPPRSRPASFPQTETVTLPPTMQTRALYVAPKNAGEAARAAAEARRRGLNQLWVEVGGEDLLAAAIAAGNDDHLPVFAVVRLLRRPPARAGDAGDPEGLDINILGETASAHATRRASAPGAAWQNDVASQQRFAERPNWLRPDVPATVTALKKWLAGLASTPKLAGIVLRDTAAPGYADPGQRSALSRASGWDLGYTPELRLQFLRREGIDPIDIDRPAFSVADLSLPFFPNLRQPVSGSSFRLMNGEMVREVPTGDTPLEKWNALRHEANVHLMREIFAAVRGARPDLPLLLRERSPLSPASGWYALWEKADALPHHVLDAEQGRAPARTAKSQSSHVLLNVSTLGWLPRPVRGGTAPDPSPAQRFARSLRFSLGSNKGPWDGIVLDLSEEPMDKVLSLLEGLAPAP